MDFVTVSIELRKRLQAKVDEVVEQAMTMEEPPSFIPQDGEMPQLDYIEKEVLGLYLDGLKSSEIAKELDLRKAKVKEYLHGVEEKLGTDRRSWMAYELFQSAIETAKERLKK